MDFHQIHGRQNQVFPTALLGLQTELDSYLEKILRSPMVDMRISLVPQHPFSTAEGL